MVLRSDYAAYHFKRHHRERELKKNPMATVSAGDGFPVAILNRNQPAFYCVPAELYEKMLDALDDQQLVKLVHERNQQPLVDVDLDSYL